MGRRKERRLAALHGAGRRVKLDLFAEPSAEAGGSSSNDGVGRNMDQNHHAGDPVSPSSSGQNQENPLTLLGQYSDEELDEEATEQPNNADELTSLAALDVQAEYGDVNSNKRHINDNDVAELVDKESDKLDTTESKEGYGVQGEEIISSAAIQNNGTDSSTHAPEASGSQIVGDVTGGWKMVMDEQSNRYYYWNTVTGETSWETPSVLALTSENISGHDVSLTIDEDKTKSLVHDHSSMQLNATMVAYSNISSDNQSLNGGGTHLSYDTTNYNPTATDIAYAESSILPNASSFHQSSHIFSEHLTSLGEVVHASSGEHKDMHMANYIESTEAAVAHSLTLIHYAESLLQRLNTLKRSGNHLADHELIMKEIEIRIADCKALSSYGSSLLPFWWHTEMQLKQLESAIGKEESSQLITSKSCNNQNGDKATVSSESMVARSEAVGENENAVALVLNDNSPSRYKSKDGEPETSNVLESKEARTEQISSGPTFQVSRDGKEPEVTEANQTGLPVDLVNKDETNAIEDVDMDVEMEVDEEIPADQTAAADGSIGEGSTLVEQQIQTSLLTTDSVPSPPPEEWIPPPPPENEEIPPPPAEEPPTSPVPPPFPETLPLHSYQEQYTTGYSVPSYEYYTPTVNEIGNNGYYAPVERCHIAEQTTPYYGPVAATAFPHLGADVSSVEPIVYYDHSRTGIPAGPAASSGESSIYYVEAGSISYHSHNNASLLDQIGNATSTMESGSSSLLPLKIETNSSAVSSGPYIVPTQPTSFTSTVQAAESSLVNGCNADATPTTANKNQLKVVRGKKRTLAVASSLRSNKKVSSLVNKWKAAKEELHGDEDEDDEPENAYEVLERKRLKEIEEWRKRQIESGEAQDNANFLPLGGDWRERVRRKRAEAKTKANRTPSPEAVDDEKKIPNLTELSKGLPSGWQPYWDESTKEVYYGNTVTSETSWTKPS